MEYTLKDSDYAYDASAKTITLATWLAGLGLGQIKYIHNITRNDVVYTPATPINTITISNGVITIAFRYGNDAHSDSDKFQIIVDVENADYSDLDEVLSENVSVDAGELLTIDWLSISGIKEITVYIKTANNCTSSIQVTDDNISANPDAFTLCAKDGDGSAVAITTNNEGKSYTFINKAEKMRVLVRNNGATTDTPYVAVK